MFLEGSEILNFSLCSWGDQKFRIFPCVLGGMRNSEFLPVFLGGFEILNFSCVLCGIRNSEFLHVFLGELEILKFCVCSWGDQKF